MSKVISNTQKQYIKVQIPASVTIDSTTYNFTKIWANQVLTSDLTISLNISQDGIETGIEDITSGILYYSCTLTVHVIVKTETLTTAYAHSGAHIAEYMMQTINNTVAGWVTPLTNDIRIFDPRNDIMTMNLSDYTAGSFDYTLSIRLYHS